MTRSFLNEIQSSLDVVRCQIIGVAWLLCGGGEGAAYVLSAEKESSGEECEEGGERDGRTKGRREVRGRARAREEQLLMGCIDLEIAAAAVSLSFALSRFSHHRPFLFLRRDGRRYYAAAFSPQERSRRRRHERDTWSSECSLKESALSDNRGSESYSASASCTAGGRGGPARRQPTPFQLTFEDSWRENGRPGDGSFVSHRRRRLRFNRRGSHLI